MQVLPKFVDMAKTATELGLNKPEVAATPEMPSQPVYPYGLSICFGQEELDKLDLEADVQVGDTVHLFCLAKVTSVSTNDTTEGPKTRVEMQITNIAVHDEDQENVEAEQEIEPHSAHKVSLAKMYGGK
jgi:hypothetical protein